MIFWKKVGTVLFFFAFFYILVLCGLCLFEETLLYHPRVRKNDKPVFEEKMPDLTEVSYFLPDGTKLYGWYRPAKNGHKIILHFHGNAYNTEQSALRVKELYSTEYGLFFPEYRGFGDIKGAISQQSMEQDAETAYKYLKGRGYKNKDIILYGHSMGTYIAVYTAAQFGTEQSFDAVILEAPFLSAAQTAAELFQKVFPVKTLMMNQYPSETLIDKINSRVFIGHGQKDALIRFHQGWQMYEKAKEPKTFFVSENASHEDLPKHGFIEAFLEWLKTPEP